MSKWLHMNAGDSFAVMVPTTILILGDDAPISIIIPPPVASEPKPRPRKRRRA